MQLDKTRTTLDSIAQEIRNSTKSLSDEPEPGMVSIQLEGIRDTIAAICNNLDILEERLQPIFNPLNTVEAEKEKESVYKAYSALAEQLGSYKHSLELFNSRICGFLQRLDL